jgi:methionyl-tRNA formyltransferase
MAERIVLLAGDNVSARIVYHALKREWDDVQVIIEQGIPRTQLLRRRARTLGYRTVAGQVLFMAFAQLWLERRATRRIEAIKRTYDLDTSPIDAEIRHVPSVNSDEARDALQRLDPRVVIVVGTRIIAKATLGAVDAPFINTHAGITPLYRGVHGGYWALAEGRPELVGTTVHLIDPGIDTGNVIAQPTFAITPDDSFATYPYLHTAAGLQPLLDAVHQALTGRVEARTNPLQLPSALRSHPTLWGYALTRIRRGVR